jgi:hypothetical protein
MYAAFAVGQKWDAGVLLDKDAEGEAAQKKIKEMLLRELAVEQQGRFKVLMLADAAGISKNEAAIEDLFDDQFYLDCVNKAFGITIATADLPVDGSAMITKRVEAVLLGKYQHKQLDKRRVMVEILRQFDTWRKVADLPNGTASRAEALFAAINNAFGG